MIFMGLSNFVKIIKKTKLMIPPLTGFTDYPYRVILSSFDPPFLITEMINARALLHKNKRTLQMIKKIDETSALQGIQLLGHEPEIMAKAAKIAVDFGFDYIDINMGCSTKRVIRRGDGVALMKDEKTASSIVRSVCDAVDIPVTVKMRIGATRKKVNVVSLSQKLADAGAVVLTVHGRTGEKKFGSNIGLSEIAKVVSNVSVPVVANGGIFSGIGAKNVIAETGAAGVMPGRGLIGNPWLVPEILSLLSDKKYESPTLLERKEVCLQHSKLLCDHYGERRGILHMRKILPRYFSSTVFLKEMKKDVQNTAKREEVKNILNMIIEKDSQFFYKKS